MQVLITGGAGFLGKKLVHQLLQRGTLTASNGEQQSIERITLFDRHAAEGLDDARITVVTGDICDVSLVNDLVTTDVQSVFHLAAVVSGEAETDFDLGMRINLDATRTLLEAMRNRGHCPRFIFTSSVAVFGGELPAQVLDTTAVTPQGSYGAQKAIGELLVSDYSRKGFIDGRALRVPTVSVRPGLPNKAASGFASGIIREPLHGKTAICPVAPDTRMWLMSPGTAVFNLITAHEIAAQEFGASRAVNLPGLSVTVGEMVAALRRVAGDAVADRIVWQEDPAISRLVRSWPGNFLTRRADALGFWRDGDFDAVIRTYISEEMGGAA